MSRHHRPGWSLPQPTPEEVEARRARVLDAAYEQTIEVIRDRARVLDAAHEQMTVGVVDWAQEHRLTYDELIDTCQRMYIDDIRRDNIVHEDTIPPYTGRSDGKRVLMADAVAGYAEEHPHETMIEHEGTTVFVGRRATTKPMLEPPDMRNLPLVLDPRTPDDQFPWRWERHNDERARESREIRKARGDIVGEDEEHKNRYASWEVQEATTEELQKYVGRHQR
jgi:hypothetical protein